MPNGNGPAGKLVQRFASYQRRIASCSGFMGGHQFAGILTGISILSSRAIDSVHLTLSAYQCLTVVKNAIQRMLARASARLVGWFQWVDATLKSNPTCIENKG